MFTSFEQAEQWLQSRLKFGIKPGLERMNVMMEKLGYPHRRPKYVHVAGTNGKGSTIAFLKEILGEAGYMVGTYTSPSLETIHERISINGSPITDEEFIHLVNTLKPVVEEVEQSAYGAPTEFEVMTAMMFYYFGRVNVPDIVLLETGLGGTYDSTNIISPLVSIITSIGHDHMEILGETLSDIAHQKAGIIKNGVPVITGVKEEEALSVIRKVANEKKAKVYCFGHEFLFQESEESLSIRTPFRHYENVNLGLKGIHQRSNASLAVMACNYLAVYYSFIIESEHILNGLARASWKGRFEQVSEDPTIVLDGAHNVEGMQALKETVVTSFPKKKVKVVFACLKDKSVSKMLDILTSFADEIMFTSFANGRARSAKELYREAQFSQKEYEENWIQAIDKVKESLTKDDVLVVTGSLYFIAEVRKYVLSE